MKNKGANLIPIASPKSTCLNFRHVYMALKLSVLLIAFNANSSQISAQSMGCVAKLNISVPQTGSGSLILSPQMLLSQNYLDYNDFDVDVDGPLLNEISCTEVGESFMVKVNHGPSDNSCWTLVTVEDKIKPIIMCPIEINVKCFDDINDFPIDYFLDATDNCTEFDDLEFSYADDIEQPVCPSLVSKIIYRTWTVADALGNKSSCDQKIVFSRPDISLQNPLDPLDPLNPIYYPADTTISCTETDVSPDSLGYPSLMGMPFSFHCSMEAFYSDDDKPFMCEGQKQINRKWYVYDWCNSYMDIGMQEITVIDTIPPEIVCSGEIEIVSTLVGECYAEYEIPTVVALDGCVSSNLIRFEVEVDDYPNYSFGNIVQLNVGNHTIRYIAIDDCFNKDTCEVEIVVQDLESPVFSPVLSCGSGTAAIGVFTLENDGTVHVPAKIFMSKVSDNCYLGNLFIRRIEDLCGHPEDLVFGELVNFCCLDTEGFTEVELFASDYSGNTSTCLFHVDIQEKESPMVTCQDITVYLDEMGMVTPVPDSAKVIAIDNCGIDTLILEPNKFDCTLLGDQNAELIAFDFYMNSDTCETIITVLDTIPPVAICRDTVLYLGTDGTVDLIWSDIFADSIENCVIVERTLDEDRFDCSNIGLEIVELTIKDQSGNMGSCTSAVMVRDTVKPVCQLQDITIYLDDDGKYTLGIDDVYPSHITDNCGVSIVDFQVGQYNCNTLKIVQGITFTAYDISLNSRICSLYVTTKDTIPPVVKCPPDVTITTGCSSPDEVFNLSPLSEFTATDICGVREPFIDYIDTLYNCGINPYTIELKFIPVDAEGNKDSCSQIITVDKIPVISGQQNYPLSIASNENCVNFPGLALDVDNCSPYVDIQFSGSGTSGYSITRSGTDYGTITGSGTSFDNLMTNDGFSLSEYMFCGQGGEFNIQFVATDCSGSGSSPYLVNFNVTKNNLLPDEESSNDIFGYIQLPNGIPVPGVSVYGTGLKSREVMTDQMGYFDFGEINTGEIQSLMPYRADTDWNNGLTVNDLVLLQKIIIGIDTNPSPFKYIAGDADRSGMVSVSDLLQLQKIILGMESDLSIRNPWRFIDGQFNFGKNGMQHQMQFLPELIWIDDKNAGEHNFNAVKLGDLDGDVKLQKSFKKSYNEFVIHMDDVELKAGIPIKVTIPILSEDMNSIQIGISWNDDIEVLDVKTVYPGILNGDVHTKIYYEYPSNQMRVLGFHINEVSDQIVEFHIIPKENNLLSEVLKIDETYNGMVFSSSGQILRPIMKFTNEIDEQHEMPAQFIPNPFSTNAELLIGGHLPGNELGVRIFDVTGKMIFSSVIDVDEASSPILLTHLDFPSSGMYIAQFTAGGDQWNQKLVHVKK